jgi:hypothetical protein
MENVDQSGPGPKQPVARQLDFGLKVLVQVNAPDSAWDETLFAIGSRTMVE